MTGKSQDLRYRTLRALRVLNYRRPGVPLRSTPGFMLPPAARVWKRQRAWTCSDLPKVCRTFISPPVHDNGGQRANVPRRVASARWLMDDSSHRRANDRAGAGDWN